MDNAHLYSSFDRRFGYQLFSLKLSLQVFNKLIRQFIELFSLWHEAGLEINFAEVSG
jgi:hypothetical protein